jgi:hypothetical protein
MLFKDKKEDLFDEKYCDTFILQQSFIDKQKIKLNKFIMKDIQLNKLKSKRHKTHDFSSIRIIKNTKILNFSFLEPLNLQEPIIN